MDFIETSRQCIFTRQLIFEIECSKKGSNSEKSQQVFDEVVKYIDFECEESELCVLLKCVQYLCKRIVVTWKKNHRSKSLVLKNQSDWLATKETVFFKLETLSSSPKNQELKANKRGRPTSDFSNSSKRTKQRRIARLAETDGSAADVLRSVCSEPTQICVCYTFSQIYLPKAKIKKHSCENRNSC